MKVPGHMVLLVFVAMTILFGFILSHHFNDNVIFTQIIIFLYINQGDIKMKKTAIAFLILFVFPVYSFADKAEFSHFYEDYTAVSHSLMSDQGRLNELTELLSLDKDAADQIADFWLFRAKRECYDFVEKIKSNIDFKDLYKEIDYYVDKPIRSVSGGKYDEIQKNAQKEAEQCRYSIYYDNWDAINKMILNKFNTIKEENKKKGQ
jgi:hypothetical protein